MHTDSAAKPAATAAPTGQDELAEGLMLVRASTLKVIRLQLALERRDRKVALEAVDDLVALDRSLRDHLASVPAVRDQVVLGQYLEAERAALNLEKLGLTAQVIRNDSPDALPAVLPPPRAVEPTGSDADSATIRPGDQWPADEWADELDPDPPRRILPWLAGLAVLLPALAGAAYWLDPPAVLAWLDAASGWLRALVGG